MASLERLNASELRRICVPVDHGQIMLETRIMTGVS